LFLAFETIYKAEVKLIFARHVKALGYYSSMQFDLQHLIAVSAECEVHPGGRGSCICWQTGWRATAPVWRLWNKERSL